MSVINRFNTNNSDGYMNESNNQHTYVSESFTEKNVENVSSADSQDPAQILDELTVYIIKINNTTKCYCSTKEEVKIMVNYFIEYLLFKKISEGWNNVKCLRNKENEIMWKTIDSNKMVTQIIGNKPNALIFYDNIISEIEVETVKNYTLINVY